MDGGTRHVGAESVKYFDLLKRLRSASGKTWRDLKMRAVRLRKKMISRPRRKNKRKHAEDKIPRVRYSRKAMLKVMPAKYRELLKKKIESRAGGRAALKKYRSFTGLPFPTEIKKLDVGPKNRDYFAVGMGRSPTVLVADGPRGKQKKIRKYRGKFTPIFTPDGRNIAVLSGRTKGFGKNLKFVGYAPETHYVMTDDMEKAGSFKSGKYWVHEHHDEGGKWPKVFRDSAGNFFYARGTYRVGKWIRK